MALVVCGHVHRCGGQSEKLGNATVINVASHDSPGSLGRIAVIDIQNNGQLNIRWHWLPGLQGIWDIGPGYKIALENKGITTVEELASADPEAVSKILNSGLPRARQLCARAKAGIQNTHIVLSEPKLPRGEWIFLDIETDPGQSWAWLIGVFSEHDHCFRQFFAKHPREEKGMLEDFVKYAQSQPNAIFLSKSGNNVDSRVPLARIKHYGLEEHFRSRIEDIHKALAESVVLPVRGFDLKTVASYFGYQFRHPDLDGRMVPFEYDEYVRSQNPAVAKRLLEYNEDDVMSLRYIVRKLMGTE
ncbi:MAG: hypothetical protein A3J28_18685 [Acidobacteria bacterium RIFCSPLOWO2_12_FULL_60_22]|nr:MAG: hypothetical protein A3J28_18685 [Acidobacteria bacterium RIFCSPLOWO2_12_FULL_60_22]